MFTLPSKTVVLLLIVLCTQLPSVSRAAEAVDGSDKLERMLKSADLDYEKKESFFIIVVKMPSRHEQSVFVTRKARVFGDVPFVEITAIGWRWNDASFSRENANWLLAASSITKIGGWQALAFDDGQSVAAEFKATLPLTTTSKTLAAAIKAVASSANDLHRIMDR